MNRVSLENDIRLTLRDYYATRIAYPVTGGASDEGVSQVTGEIDGIPYGDLYAPGDIYLDPVGDNQLGLIYYVVHSKPGDPTITVQLESSSRSLRPKVVLVDGIWQPEKVHGASRVYVGLRSRPTARAGFVRSLHAGRVLHEDREHVIATVPIWRGGFWIHVDGIDRWETSYVLGMLNTRIVIEYSAIYKLNIDLRPRQVQLVNLENSGLFRNVLAVDVDARLTPNTPLDQLPDGLPDDLYWPYQEIVGVSPVMEPNQEDDPLPKYGEKVGDFPLSETADNSSEAPFEYPELN